MKKGRYQKQNAHPAGRYIIVLCIVAIVLIVLFLMFPKKNTAIMPNGEQYQPTEAAEKNQGTISIPGYEAITLEAGKRQQTVGFPNPAANNCYFVISLYLEDGTLLWCSDLVEPGAISDAIVLKQPLEVGSYPNSVLKYQCFAMDEHRSPLNGAETKLTLWVK